MKGIYVRNQDGEKTLIVVEKITHFVKSPGSGAVSIHLVGGSVVHTNMYWGFIRKKLENAKELPDINSKRYGGW